MRFIGWSAIRARTSRRYAGGYDAVRRFAGRWRREQRGAGGAAFVPLVFPPGDAYQFDWSHELVELDGMPMTVKVAHVRLCHSRHPCLDALIETSTALIGVESKRYEPFRAKPAVALSHAYWRSVWGNAMAGYERVRDNVRDDGSSFMRLDAAQLVKHALALRTAVHRDGRFLDKQPVLLYLYAEPERWPDGRPVRPLEVEAHRDEIGTFVEIVAGDEVAFRPCSYRELLSTWGAASNADLQVHAAALAARFDL